MRRFYLESLHELQNSLRKLGSDLIFSLKPPKQIARQILDAAASECSSLKLYYNIDYGCAAEEEADAVEAELHHSAKDAGMCQIKSQGAWYSS